MLQIATCEPAFKAAATRAIFYSHRQHNTSFSCGRVCETKTLHLEPLASSATKSLGHCCRIFIELNFCSIEDTVTGYMSNHFRLLSQNSFVDVELPVRYRIAGVAAA